MRTATMYKKLLISFGFAISLITVPTFAWAQTKVGVVNTERILTESTMAKNSQAKLEKEFSARQKDVETQGTKVQSMIQAYEKDATTLSASDRASRESKIQQEDQKYREMATKFQNDLNKRRNEELQALLDKANDAVKKVATSDKFDLILTEAAYVKTDLDITDKVLKMLNGK